MIPITRGATNRRSASGRIAPYQARRFAPPTEDAAPARLMTAAIAAIVSGAAISPAWWAGTTAASRKPRVSPTARIPSVTPRRFPSVRRRSVGTRSCADENANGRTPMTVATAGGVPRARRSGMVRPSPARAKTPAAVSPIPWNER